MADFKRLGRGVDPDAAGRSERWGGRTGGNHNAATIRKPNTTTLRSPRAFHLHAALAGLVMALPMTASAANITKANTATMNLSTDWNAGAGPAPTSADTATWQSSPISLANNLALSLGGADLSVLGLDLRPNGTANPSLKIASGNIINLGTGGANQSNGAWNTTLNCGINTYSGTTIIQGGTLLAYKPAALPNFGASGTFTLNSANNSTLAVRAGGTGEWSATDIGNLLANASFTCLGASSNGLGFDTTSGDFTYGNIIPAKLNLGIEKLGPNTLTLAAANLYPGATNIHRGTVKLDNTASGSLAATSGLTFTGTGTFNYNTASTPQSLGTLTLSAGEGTVQLTRSADAALTFSALAARPAGAMGNLSLSGGTPSAANGFNLTGAALGFINQGTFFGGADYAYMDAAGTFVRAPNYGTDSGFTTAGTITASTHVKLTSTPGTQAAITLNTLNLAGSGVGLPLSGTLTLANNGLLKSGGGSAGTISGGNINVTNNASATTKELVVRTDASSDSLTISSVVGTDAPSRTGTTLTTSAIVTGLSGTADLTVGMTVVIGGNGTTRTINSIDSSSQITLSGNAPVAGSQTLVFLSGTLTKSGAGTLTLNGANTLAGGVNLNAGRLNLGSPTALGGGVPSSGTAIGRLTINEGTTIDNTWGAPLTMTYKYAMTWNGSFTFVGTNDLYFVDPGGNGNITMPNDITITTQTKDITLRTYSNFTVTTATAPRSSISCKVRRTARR